MRLLLANEAFQGAKWLQKRGGVLGLGSSKWPDAIWSLTHNLLAIIPRGGIFIQNLGFIHHGVNISKGKGNVGDLHSSVRVNMDEGVNGGETTKLIWNLLSLESRSKWKDFYTRNVAFEWTRTTMKPWSSSMNLSWWGDVSNEMEGGKREVSHAPCCNLMKVNTLSIDRLCLGKHS